MRTNPYKTGLLALLLGTSACTLITDANERNVADAEGDLRFVFKNMTVHESVPMDVAIVNQDNVLQGRARIIMPPKPPVMEYPDVPLIMKSTLGGGTYRLFFYIDDDNDNLVDRNPMDDGVLEHIWQEAVPKNRPGTFTHNIRFMPFTEQDITSIGGDIVLEAPSIPENVSNVIKLCLAQKFNAVVRKNLEVKVFLVEDLRQIAYFETFRNNPTPSSVRLSGIVDAPNSYRFDVFVDGEQKSSFNRDSEVGKDLILAAVDWFPLSVADLGTCLR